MSVNLWDDDTTINGGDEHLGVTVTDWKGYWLFVVDNNDGTWQGGRDIYYSFKLENKRISVEDCDYLPDSTYEWESAVHEDVSDGAVIDFGNETGSTHNNAMRIWSYLNIAWNHAELKGGWAPSFVDTCYPEEGGAEWEWFWKEIDIPEEYYDSPNVVSHEYGHAIMWYAYDDEMPGPGGDHSFDQCEQDEGLAWSEGWANGFSLSADPEKNGIKHYHEGDSGKNIENFSESCKKGEKNEGRIAAAIYDMLDAKNDHNGGDLNRGRNGYWDNNSGNRVPLSAMLRDTLLDGPHSNIGDFWNSLLGMRI